MTWVEVSLMCFGQRFSVSPVCSFINQLTDITLLCDGAVCVETYHGASRGLQNGADDIQCVGILPNGQPKLTEFYLLLQFVNVITFYVCMS